MLALCRPEHHGSTPKGTPLKFCPKWPTIIDLSVGDIRSQIAAGWLQIAQRSQWRAYRKPPSLFRWCQRWPPTTSPSPKWGFHMPPRYANGHIFATVRPIHFMWCLVIGWAFRGRRIEWRKTSCELWSTTQKIEHVSLDPTNGLFSGDYISTLSGAGPSNALEIDQGTVVPRNFMVNI